MEHDSMTTVAPSARANLLLVGVTAVGALLLWRMWTLDSSVGGVHVSEAGVADRVESDARPVSVLDDQWVKRAAAAPVRVDYATSAGLSDGGLHGFQSRGPLSASEKMRLRSHVSKSIEALYGVWTAECAKPGTGPDGQKTPRDAAAEMHELLMAVRAEVHLDMIDKDGYLTVDPGDASGMRWPPGYMRSTLRGFKVDGKAVEVVFGVSPSDHRVERLLEEIRIYEGIATEDDIKAFNELPMEVRKQRFDESMSAVALIRSISRENLSMEERALRMDGLVEKVLPGSWHVDPSSYYARVRD